MLWAEHASIPDARKPNFKVLVTVKPPKAAASSGNLVGQVGLYPKARIGVVPV